MLMKNDDCVVIGLLYIPIYDGINVLFYVRYQYNSVIDLSLYLQIILAQ